MSATPVICLSRPTSNMHNVVPGMYRRAQQRIPHVNIEYSSATAAARSCQVLLFGFGLGPLTGQNPSLV